ncbi:fasciclin [Aureimonas sp. SA4125]|uniref:fasciclin domain-containing protein n=1 Tax=Aureimonas sp. SA4125 TaxID=2826993 RepID=UPI001CC36566|nr:fasciclin domain-containing protein [Aureimonas sp. SA4125]BDA87039.1 fasciclin [Aureimonas sp. SA4125]
MITTIRSLAIASILAAGTLAATAAEPVTVGGAPMFADKTIAENAPNASNLTTLVAAVKAAGLVETLGTAGPFTVFAPDNDAFAKLPAGTVDELVKPENKEKLTKILTYHVVPAKATSEAAIQMVKDDGGKHMVKTVQGEELTLALAGDKLTVTDAAGNVATVTQADVMQSNGVVHVIDTVLMPKM